MGSLRTLHEIMGTMRGFAVVAMIFVASCSVGDDRSRQSDTTVSERSVDLDRKESDALVSAKQVISEITEYLEGEKYTYSARMFIESLVKYQAGSDLMISNPEADRIKQAIENSGALTLPQKLKCIKIIDEVLASGVTTGP